MKRIFWSSAFLAILAAFLSPPANAEPKGNIEGCLTSLYNYPAGSPRAYKGPPRISLQARVPAPGMPEPGMKTLQISGQAPSPKR